MDVRSEEGTIMLEWGIGMIFSIFILMFFWPYPFICISETCLQRPAMRR